MRLERVYADRLAAGIPALMTVPSLRGLRRRLAHFIGGPGKDRKDDYREHWMALTRRMSALRSTHEVGRELAENVVRASRATSVAVYVVDASDTAYRLSASVGGTRFARTIEHAAAVPAWLRRNALPAALPAELARSIMTPPAPVALVVAICWRTTLLGFIVLGPQRAGRDYSVEDRQFLATVAGQAAASITAIRLSEPAAEARLETTAVIHDIKNSVSALSLLARNAASHFGDPEFQRDAMVTLSRTVERMRGLLVKLSAPATATAAARAEPIDLRELILEATTPLASDGNVRLVRQLRPVSPVCGDRDALLRVVENLMTNATEAVGHEGTVTVTLAQEGAHAVISVADTGCGMSEEYQERHLFAPFRSTKQGGWGVGLYQAKQAVESQDGEILVESVKGLGTTFTVKLPLRAVIESPSLESVR
jgi:putative PEP-CTERM system histidine kinase